MSLLSFFAEHDAKQATHITAASIDETVLVIPFMVFLSYEFVLKHIKSLRPER